ncbi:Photosystem I reaction center subunit III [Thermocoleostomius sinensis]|uniref:Photosystem I reaction center subunit III n=1 Tax=Thermocoleostomius sinensis A174 TaxID=2016057 RepID=A0A9E8ZAS3_9CYAN|nr:Photosystem I reaction center subunit III [Thermocoleostomius sinensis]WAL59770.1 Photosystem I reaction center subunit III [Thermocoleostomius sinensis A174]
MRKVLALCFIVFIWFSVVPVASAVNETLVPCQNSPAFRERMKNAPDTYYFEGPFKTYASELLCGDDGLPHLPLDRPSRFIDVVIPFAIFFYFAGFVGWSGRAYLQATKKFPNPEQQEIFINLPLAMQSLLQGLLWPLLAIKEFLSGELTIKDDKQIPVSPR